MAERELLFQPKYHAFGTSISAKTTLIWLKLTISAEVIPKPVRFWQLSQGFISNSDLCIHQESLATVISPWQLSDCIIDPFSRYLLPSHFYCPPITLRAVKCPPFRKHSYYTTDVVEKVGQRLREPVYPGDRFFNYQKQKKKGIVYTGSTEAPS